MSFSVRFLKNASGLSLPESGNWQVQVMNWKLPGGADKAIIRGRIPGFEFGQWDAFLNAGIDCPIEITSSDCELVWHGWVETIIFHSGQFKITSSLDSMFNRLIVRYPKSGLEASPFERWAFTDWREDLQSVARFGAKEKLISIHQADAYLAERTLQQAFLGLQGVPSFNIAAEKNAEMPYFEVIGRGWWQRLSWVLDEGQGGKISHLAGGKSAYALGNVSGTRQLAQSFLVSDPAFSLSHIWLRVSVSGQPADDLQVAIHAEDAGKPGTLLAQADYPANALDGGWAWVHWELPDLLALTTQTRYWLVVKRSGALDAANYFQVESDDGPGYGDGALKRWDGSTWQALAQDLRFGLIAQENAFTLVQQMLERPALQHFLNGQVQWHDRELPVYGWRTLEISCKDRIEAWLAGDPQVGVCVLPQKELSFFSLPGFDEIPVQLNAETATHSSFEINPLNPSLLPGRLVLVDLPRYQKSIIVQSISWRKGKGYSWRLSALATT